MSQNPFPLSEQANEFLVRLQIACKDLGFSAPFAPGLTFDGETQRWEATYVLHTYLGKFTVHVWTSWMLLSTFVQPCQINLALGDQELLQPPYGCRDLQDLTDTLEFLVFTAQALGNVLDLRRVLRLNADPAWRATQRKKFMTLVLEGAKAVPAKKGGSA